MTLNQVKRMLNKGSTNARASVDRLGGGIVSGKLQVDARAPRRCLLSHPGFSGDPGVPQLSR